MKNGMGYLPKQIADKLRGRSFKSWDEFREALWKEVANDPVLSSQFSAVNQAEMAAGRAPYAPSALQHGGQLKFQIDHMDEIWLMGEQAVYDLDNIWVVAPKVHEVFRKGKQVADGLGP